MPLVEQKTAGGRDLLVFIISAASVGWSSATCHSFSPRHQSMILQTDVSQTQSTSNHFELILRFWSYFSCVIMATHCISCLWSDVQFSWLKLLLYCSKLVVEISIFHDFYQHMSWPDHCVLDSWTTQSKDYKFLSNYNQCSIKYYIFMTTNPHL